MSVGLFIAAFLFGLRHGFDWDHLAAISDLCGSTGSRRRGFALSLMYAVGHAVVVLALGAIAIAVGAKIPTGVDAMMGRIVGLTLILLGFWVIAELVATRGRARMRSRWMLLADSARSGVRRLRGRVGSPAAVPDAPETEGGPAPDKAKSYGSATAAGIGVVHGIGLESPTQIAIFVASMSVEGPIAGVLLLLGWICGLVAANSAIALAAGFGLLQARRDPRLHAAFASAVALASIGLGAFYVSG